jgi:hypothetical protein
MQIGETLTLGGRRYAVRGFDPEGVSPRMIYLADVAKGTHRIVPFERLPSASRGSGAVLRLVDGPGLVGRRQER